MSSPAAPPPGIARRLLGFATWPLLQFLTPLVVLPLLARHAGEGWASVVTAMAIGNVGATVIQWGWNNLGAAAVARARDDATRARIYATSVSTRAALCCVVLPVAAVLSAALALGHLRLLAALMAVAFCLVGVSPNWYCIGVGNPRLLGRRVVLPRELGTLIALPLLAAGVVEAYPVCMIVATLVTVWRFERHVFGARPHPSVQRAKAGLREGAHVAGANLAGTAYGFAPVPLATALLAAAAASSFASADQLYRYSLFAVIALGNALQGWVLEPAGELRRRRQRTAVLAHLLLGAAGGAAIALLGPWATGWLFGERVAADAPTCLAYGGAFACISASTPLLRNILLPQGRTRTVLVATLASAIVGVTWMWLAGRAGSGVGVGVGLALSEALLLAIVAISARAQGRDGTPEHAQS